MHKRGAEGSVPTLRRSPVGTGAPNLAAAPQRAYGKSRVEWGSTRGAKAEASEPFEAQSEIAASDERSKTSGGQVAATCGSRIAGPLGNAHRVERFGLTLV